MNMKLKKAVIANFECRLIDGVWVHYIIDEKTMGHPICLYDNDQNIAIDINDGTYYHVLNRNERGQLDANEYEQIKLHQNYALNVESIDWSKYSCREKMVMKLKYYKILLNLKFNIVGYSDNDKIWDEREAWRSNYVNGDENTGKVKNIANNNRNGQRKH